MTSDTKLEEFDCEILGFTILLLSIFYYELFSILKNIW